MWTANFLQIKEKNNINKQVRVAAVHVLPKLPQNQVEDVRFNTLGDIEDPINFP